MNNNNNSVLNKAEQRFFKWTCFADSGDLSPSLNGTRNLFSQGTCHTIAYKNTLNQNHVVFVFCQTGRNGPIWNGPMGFNKKKEHQRHMNINSGIK